MHKTARFAVAAMTLAGSFAVTPALADLTMPKQLLPGFDSNQIVQIAEEIGLTASLIKGSGGATAAQIDTTSGTFYAIPTVCRTSTCYGMELIADFGAGPEVPLKVLNYFNHYRVFTKAYLQDGHIFLSRYEIADFGIPKGNVASNLANFIDVAKDFDRFLARQLSASSQTPGHMARDTVQVLTGGSANALTGGPRFVFDHRSLTSQFVTKQFNAQK